MGEARKVWGAGRAVFPDLARPTLTLSGRRFVSRTRRGVVFVAL